MKKEMTLKPSGKAVVSDIIGGICWLGTALLLVWLALYIQASLYADFEATTYRQFMWSKGDLSVIQYVWVGVGLIAIFVAALMGIGLAIGTLALPYVANRWVLLGTGQIEITSYGFPFSKTTKTVRYHRIIGVKVEQGAWGRIFGTGDLKLKTITYANADTVEQETWIHFVSDPIATRKSILEGLPDYEGLAVKMVD